MRIRDIATCVALGLGVIGRSVSDISQILINSKKTLITSLRSVGLRQISLILDKKLITYYIANT